MAKAMPETIEVPITPEMRNLLQIIVNHRDAARNELQAREKAFSDAIILCAAGLGIKPEDISGFDIAKAAFIVKKAKNG